MTGATAPRSASSLRVAVVVLVVAACGGQEPPPRVPAGPSASPPAAPTQPAAPVRARDVMVHADEWLGRELVVDVYEALYDSEHTSSAEEGEVTVNVPDVGTDILNLVGARNDADVVRGALQTLPAIAPPVRVRGWLERDTRRESMSGRTWRQIVVEEITPLSWPEPEPLPDPQAVVDDRARWNGRYVVVEGDWYGGFEASYLGRVWLSLYPDAVVRCQPDPDDSEERHVRVIGFVHAGAEGYGHMGRAPAEIEATELTYLEPHAPGCPQAEPGTAAPAPGP